MYIRKKTLEEFYILHSVKLTSNHPAGMFDYDQIVSCMDKALPIVP